MNNGINYIISRMVGKSQKFLVNISFEINGHEVSAQGILDTGCSKSLISANLIYDHYNYSKNAVDDAIGFLAGKVKAYPSFGVEGDPKSYKYPKTLDQTLKDPNLRFPKSVNKLTINGYELGDIELSITYTVKNLNLIGMDIIKHLNCIISNDTNGVYFLATRKEIVKVKDLIDSLRETVESLSSDEDEYIDFSELDIEAHGINKMIQHESN